MTYTYLRRLKKPLEDSLKVVGTGEAKSFWFLCRTDTAWFVSRLYFDPRSTEKNTNLGLIFVRNPLGNNDIPVEKLKEINLLLLR